VASRGVVLCSGRFLDCAAEARLAACSDRPSTGHELVTRSDESFQRGVELLVTEEPYLHRGVVEHREQRRRIDRAPPAPHRRMSEFVRRGGDCGKGRLLRWSMR
jgi:hypothetical protein